MRARLRFVNYPYFNYPPDKIMCPGELVGRGEGRSMWTLCFTVTRQISALVYEGDLKWLAAPAEQDFGPGVRFKLFAGTKGRMAGKETLPQPEDTRSDREKKSDKKAGKDVDKAKQARVKPEDKGAEVKPDKPDKPGQGGKDDKLKHLPKDAYDRVPRQGMFAEGVLLG